MAGVFERPYGTNEIIDIVAYVYHGVRVIPEPHVV